MSTIQCSKLQNGYTVVIQQTSSYWTAAIAEYPGVGTTSDTFIGLCKNIEYILNIIKEVHNGKDA